MCLFYKYEWSPIGYIGGCSKGLLGGLHVITCYGKGDCEYYQGSEPVKEELERSRKLTRIAMELNDRLHHELVMEMLGENEPESGILPKPPLTVNKKGD